MALTLKQRRRRDSIIGLTLTAIIIGVFVVPAVLKAVVAPRIPGYLTHAPAGSYTELDWKLLSKGYWPNDDKPNIPADIKALDGKMVSVHACMIPFHSDFASSQWYLAEKPRMCYFCSPPGIAEVVEVHIANNNKLQLTDWPVRAYGRLKVATGAEKNASLYTLENAVLVIG